MHLKNLIEYLAFIYMLRSKRIIRHCNTVPRHCAQCSSYLGKAESAFNLSTLPGHCNTIAEHCVQCLIVCGQCKFIVIPRLHV